MKLTLVNALFWDTCGVHPCFDVDDGEVALDLVLHDSTEVAHLKNSGHRTSGSGNKVL